MSTPITEEHRPRSRNFVAAHPIAFAVTLLLVLAAVLGSRFVLPTTYTATSVVVVEPLTADPFASGQTTQQINIASETQIATSSVVTERASKDLGGKPSSQDLDQNAEATAEQGTVALKISYTASSAKDAAKGANALAAAYLENRSDTAQKTVDQISQRIDQQIAAAGSNQGGIDQLNQKKANLQNVPLNPGHQVTMASQPSKSDLPSIKVFAAAAVLAGLLAALLVSFLLERFDSRVRSPGRLARAVSGPILTGPAPSNENAQRNIARTLTLLVRDRDFNTMPHSLALTSTSGQVGDATIDALEQALREQGADLSTLDDVRGASDRAIHLAAAVRSERTILFVDANTRQAEVEDFLREAAEAGATIDAIVVTKDKVVRRGQAVPTDEHRLLPSAPFQQDGSGLTGSLGQGGSGYGSAGNQHPHAQLTTGQDAQQAAKEDQAEPVYQPKVGKHSRDTDATVSQTDESASEESPSAEAPLDGADAVEADTTEEAHSAETETTESDSERTDAHIVDAELVEADGAKAVVPEADHTETEALDAEVIESDEPDADTAVAETSQSDGSESNPETEPAAKESQEAATNRPSPKPAVSKSATRRTKWVRK